MRLTCGSTFVFQASQPLGDGAGNYFTDHFVSAATFVGIAAAPQYICVHISKILQVVLLAVSPDGARRKVHVGQTDGEDASDHEHQPETSGVFYSHNLSFSLLVR